MGNLPILAVLRGSHRTHLLYTEPMFEHCKACAGQECDPDLCGNCRDTCMGHGAPNGRMPCHNMRLRLHQHKRVGMGRSDVTGWGAFVQAGLS